ncbi:MAG: DMT family transporter [Inquilinaceae bacterium]
MTGTARGIGFMILAVSLFSIMDTIIKYLGDGFSPVQVYFFRGLFALLPLAVVILRTGGPSSLKTRRLPGLMLAALLLLGFLLCFFLALTLLPLTDVYAISFVAPLLITILGVLVLRERVGLRRWIAILVGFGGVLVILRPGSETLQPGALLVLLSAALYAGSMIQVRRLSRTETNGAIVFYTTVVGVVLAGLALPFFWITPAGADWGYLIAIGVLGGIGQICITEAYRTAPAAVVSPFQYATILWGIALGFILFGDVPKPLVLVGAAIVIASGLYILYRETRLDDPKPTEHLR